MQKSFLKLCTTDISFVTQNTETVLVSICYSQSFHMKSVGKLYSYITTKLELYYYLIIIQN